jgi:hypothetical protein
MQTEMHCLSKTSQFVPFFLVLTELCLPTPPGCPQPVGQAANRCMLAAGVGREGDVGWSCAHHWRARRLGLAGDGRTVGSEGGAAESTAAGGTQQIGLLSTSSCTASPRFVHG